MKSTVVTCDVCKKALGERQKYYNISEQKVSTISSTIYCVPTYDRVWQPPTDYCIDCLKTYVKNLGQTDKLKCF